MVKSGRSSRLPAIKHRREKMNVIKGIPAFSGIAIGKVFYYRKAEYEIKQYLISNVRKEVQDFHRARRKVLDELRILWEKNMEENASSDACRRQSTLLEGGSFAEAVEEMILSEKVGAAYAVQTTRDELAEAFRNLEEPVIQQRVSDVQDVSGRLIEALGGVSRKISLGEEPVILMAQSLTPAEILEMEKEKLLAVVLQEGSGTSHTAIMAKSMGIPSLVKTEISDEYDGHMAIVDGYTGTLYLDPEEELQKEYEIRRKADMKERKELLALRKERTVTRDGKEIALFANIGNLDDLNSVSFYGAAGIGLLRSEFQYLGRENYPRENELFLAYKKVAETMGERIAVIRTADLGADKQAEYLDIPKEVNPIMGNRGIRLCLDRKRMFKAQLRAIYRASAYGNLALMYPMISSEKELDEIEELIEEVKEGLREKDIPFKDIPTGIMIETPAAVMIAGELARRVDFLSLGTNDLAQYTLAMDRQNPLLSKKYDDHHPAIFRMMELVVQAGHENGCQVGICGELAADTSLAKTLLEMGMDWLSVVPACILPVRKAIREIELSVS
jgi:phosphotransferase system enzyme I (PtsI)